MTTLRITEIFLSIQGESSTVGRPTAFVRLTGCPLRCQYCDTTYAFSGGTLRSIDEICEEVRGYGVRHVTVTGGEPLAQPNVLKLLSQLCDLGLQVALETSGALDISAVDARVVRVVDFKTPGSGEVLRNRFENVACLTERDQIKFVICDASDYAWAKFKCDEFRLYDKVPEILFSPSASELNPTDLAQWIVEDRLDVRMQLQMHKLLWGDVAGR